MTVTHTTRPASADEIAAEMDRRGKVIERLEMELAAALAESNREIMHGMMVHFRDHRDALAHIVRAFVDHYPVGINPFLDDAYRAGLTAMEAARSEKEPG